MAGPTLHSETEGDLAGHRRYREAEAILWAAAYQKAQTLLQVTSPTRKTGVYSTSRGSTRNHAGTVSAVVSRKQETATTSRWNGGLFGPSHWRVRIDRNGRLQSKFDAS